MCEGRSRRSALCCWLKSLVSYVLFEYRPPLRRGPAWSRASMARGRQTIRPSHCNYVRRGGLGAGRCVRASQHGLKRAGAVMITRRSSKRRCMFRPSRALPDIYLYLRGVISRRYGIDSSSPVAFSRIAQRPERAEGGPSATTRSSPTAGRRPSVQCEYRRSHAGPHPRLCP